jgi:hypothetical protein
MRDRYEDDYDIAGEDRQRGWRARFGARLSLWTGAILAMAIIVGVAVWGYRLTQREASAIPVIHAALTQAKVQPRDTGAAAPRDIASYDAGGGAKPAPGIITFAPPPERPAAEDVAMGSLQEPAGTPATKPQPAEAPAMTGPAGDATGLAPAASPVAPGRPANLAQHMEAARSAASEEAKLSALAEASAVQIQLGAFPSREQTEAEWARIYKANEDILQRRALVVQSTISGGRRFFRLRAGPFKDRVEAQNICRALQARGQDCLVAVNG